MSSTMRFAKATVSDIPTLVAIVNAAYQGDPLTGDLGWTHEKGIMDSPRISLEETNELRNTETANIFKVEEMTENEKVSIVGCVRVETMKDIEDKTYGYLSLLSVHPSRQANGVGSQLLEGAEAWAKGEGLDYLQMMVTSIRDELIQFYKRRGYMETGDRIAVTDVFVNSTKKACVEFDLVKLTKKL